MDGGLGVESHRVSQRRPAQDSQPSHGRPSDSDRREGRFYRGGSATARATPYATSIHARHAAQSARRPGTRPHAFPQVRGPVGHYGATVRKRAHHSQRVRVRVPDGAPTLMAHPPCMASADDLLSSPGPTSLRVSSPPVARAANVVAPDREERRRQRQSCVALVDRQVVIVRAVVLPSRTCHFPSHSSRGKGLVTTVPW